VPQANPKNFGAIKDGHAIKLGKGKELTHWNQSFEHFFDGVDGALPTAVEWVQQFQSEVRPNSLPIPERLQALSSTDSEIDTLLGCMVSLDIRSPQFRNRIGRFIGAVQQWDYTRDDQTLINLNLRDAYKRLTEGTSRGKMLILKSPHKEFVFGDGFFTNYTSTLQVPSNAKIILPLTPCTAVMFIQPTQYSTEPRLGLLELSEDEANFINYATQVYSCDSLFYRSQKPELVEDFTCQEFMNFQFNQHPWIEELTQHVSRRFG
jgi:hypothetical protein